VSSFDALARELDAWQARGRRATLWWRDDDAVSDTPELRRLLQLTERHAIPLALAVIPSRLEQSLVSAVAAQAQVTVLQHGFAHRNHAPAGERAAELGAHRPHTVVIDELARGHAILTSAFGASFVPALVPPWNRIDIAFIGELPRAGLAGVSTFAPRAARLPGAAVVQCNSHVDLIAWRHGRGFIGSERALQRTIEHLRARRENQVDAEESTGVLTHHLDLDPAAWDFLDALLAATRAHPAVQWCAARALFTSGRSA
jgi:hypothetical protein